jgi:hypothetical protein
MDPFVQLHSILAEWGLEIVHNGGRKKTKHMRREQAGTTAGRVGRVRASCEQLGYTYGIITC